MRRALIPSQIATASKRNRYQPYAFTEHGAVMLASVLNSKVAVQATCEPGRVIHLLSLAGLRYAPTPAAG